VPHVKLIDNAERTDGALSRSDLAYDPEGNRYVCPGGKELRKMKRILRLDRLRLPGQAEPRTSCYWPPPPKI
jgi:hypothetical protein